MLLARVVLRVRSPDTLARFYTDHLGMQARTEGHALIVGYGGTDAEIELRPSKSNTSYAYAHSDRYWKIGITLPNVDIAHAQLRRAGVAVKNPTQFKQIGYMCHLCDPEGFLIELLQHTFLGNRDDEVGDPDKVLGGGARIGQITLRVSNLRSALAFYRDRLGMKLLSIQPVEEFGFTLYFLAFTSDNPPDADLEAIKNREWLWKRPYTTLEFQHFKSQKNAFGFSESDDPGFAGILISGSDRPGTSLRDEAGGRVSLIR